MSSQQVQVHRFLSDVPTRRKTGAIYLFRDGRAADLTGLRQRRCLPTAPSNKRQKQNSTSATLVLVLSYEKHIDLLSDCAHGILDDKEPLHRMASLFLRHPHEVYNQASVCQQRDHLWHVRMDTVSYT